MSIFRNYISEGKIDIKLITKIRKEFFENIVEKKKLDYELSNINGGIKITCTEEVSNMFNDWVDENDIEINIFSWKNGSFIVKTY